LTVAVVHHTTMTPTKLELLARWLPEQTWYAGTGDDLSRAGGFRLDDPAGEVGIEVVIVTAGDGAAYVVPMTYRGAPLAGADDALIGTSEHGVLGTRWIYDGDRDAVLRAQLAALVRGEVRAQAQNESNAADPSVLVEPLRDCAEARIIRRPTDGDDRPESRGYVSATWRRADGSTVRGIVATAP
jgi:hypothetical protein